MPEEKKEEKPWGEKVYDKIEEKVKSVFGQGLVEKEKVKEELKAKFGEQIGKPGEKDGMQGYCT